MYWYKILDKGSHKYNLLDNTIEADLCSNNDAEEVFAIEARTSVLNFCLVG